MKDILKDLILPTDEEIKHDTHRLKNSIGNKRKWKNPTFRKQMDAYVNSSKGKKDRAERGRKLQAERSYPFRLIFPDGTVKNFKGNYEARKEFGNNMKKKKTYIHVNQHIIRANRKNGTDDPVITVKQGSKNTYCSRVRVLGPSEVIYGGNDRPLLSCGARVVIETEADVEIVE
jgi:hypothetical protein